MARAPYFVQLKPAITAGKVKKFEDLNLLAVLAPVETTVYWRKKKKSKKGEIIWKDYQEKVKLNPGIVLHPKWRPLSEFEREFSQEKLQESRIFQKEGQSQIRIVEQIKDLPAAVRQTLRHILADLTYRKRKDFSLTGDASQMEEFIKRLNKLIIRYTRSKEPGLKTKETASRELSQISQALEKARDTFKKSAFKEIESARQSSVLETPIKMAEASVFLLQRRLLDYKLAFESIRKAEKWFGLMITIEELFKKGYQQLGRLAEELEEALRRDEIGLPLQVLETANKAYNLWLEFNREVYFNPYYERIQKPEFRGLQYIKTHAQAGKADTVLRIIKRAVSNLEVIAIGEKPSLAELEKQKKSAFVKTSVEEEVRF